MRKPICTYVYFSFHFDFCYYITAIIMHNHTLFSFQNDVRVNDLVIAKLKGFDWWFGRVISYKQARKPRPPEGMCWLYWFGDHKLSQV